MARRGRNQYSADPVIRIGTVFVEIQKQLFDLELTDKPLGLSSMVLRVRRTVFDRRRPVRPLDSDDDLKLGAEVYIAMPAPGQPRPISMFAGWVTAIEAVFGEGPEAYVIHAEDALQHTRMRRRTRTHQNLDLGQLTRDVCEGTGLTTEDAESAFRSMGLNDLGVQVQLDESDLAFLRRLLSERDLELQVVQGVLQIRPASQLTRGQVTLDVREDKLRCRFIADLAHQVDKVTVAGFDDRQGQPITVSSATENLGPGQGRTGKQALARAFEARGADIRSRSEHVGHVPVLDAVEAQAVADTMASARGRQFVTLDATAPGNPSIRVGTKVEVTGATARFNNTYLVVETCHRFDHDEGYRTDFVAQTAYLGVPT